MARRGELLLRCLGLGLPGKLLLPGSWSSVLYTLLLNGLVRARSSRQAPLAGALPPWPGKLLLPGASSRPGKLLLPGASSWMFGLLLALPWQALVAGCCHRPCTSWGTKEPLLSYTDRTPR